MKELKIPEKILKGLELNKWYRIIGSYDGETTKWTVIEEEENK